jgi:hypothetical protein
VPRTSGERLAAVEAILQRMETYEHDRWHKLANDLQPIMDLPRQMAIETGRLEGKFEAAIKRSITEAVGPILVDIDALKREMEALKTAHDRATGSANTLKAILQSPLVSGFVGALAALIAVGIAYLKGMGK